MPSARDVLLSMQSRPWRCRSCGETHSGFFDLSAYAPAYWQHAEVYEPNGAFRTDGDFLSEDFCVVSGKYFFVRCVLLMPIAGMDKAFGFGVWSSLSETNFRKYAAGFDEGTNDSHEPWFGRLSNSLKWYPDTLNLHCEVYLQSGRMRPRLVVTDDSHPIATHIREGIPPEALLAIFAANGHEPDA